MKYRYVRRLQALVLTGALGTVAFAATPQPTVPVIRFPGADWKRVACTVGPAVPENATVDRVVREFIDGVQRGHVDPKHPDCRLWQSIPPEFDASSRRSERCERFNSGARTPHVRPGR